MHVITDETDSCMNYDRLFINQYDKPTITMEGCGQFCSKEGFCDAPKEGKNTKPRMPNAGPSP